MVELVEFPPRVIDDVIYGPTEITEQVLLDLLDSKTVTRTRRISQLGLPQQYHYLKTFSRESHNIGAMILVRKLDGSLDEQIASLLHDTSHTAFSHMIDWIVGSQERADFQDNGHAEFLRKSDAAAILSKNGLDIEKYIDHHPYTLLEQEMPKLCADRVDYALRELKVSGFNPGIVPGCVKSLINHDGLMVFNNMQAAKDFGWGFLQLQIEDWGSPKPISRYMLFVKRLKKAIDSGLITMNDFNEDDNFVLDKVKRGNSRLWSEFEQLRKPLEQIPDYPEIRGTVVKHKFRYVDPEYIQNEQLLKLSEIDNRFSEAIKSAKQRNNAGIVL